MAKSESIELLPPELGKTKRPLCFEIDRYLGPIHVHFRLCLQLIIVGNTLTLEITISWGTQEKKIKLPIIASCQRIVSFGIVDIEFCISNVSHTAGHPTEFDISVKACIDFVVIGHRCITLLHKHIGLGILRVEDLRSAEKANEIELDPKFKLTGQYVAFLYEHV
jgi:hypothetical protein